MNAVESKIGRYEPKQTWSVVVVYENATTRERAMSVCDHLVRQFWTDIEFQFHWWRTDFLEVGDIATSAASDAAAADFVIVCAGAERELSPGVKAWFESWVGRRSGHGGALVDLTEAGPVSASRAQHIQTCLRQIARRAMMDYLTKAPSATTGSLPDSFESVAIRARQVTSVLDDILHLPPPPPRYGLNE